MLGWRTVMIVLAGMVLGVLGLSVRERLWSHGPGLYPAPTPAAAPSGATFRVFVFDAESGAAIREAKVWFDDDASHASVTAEDGWVTVPVPGDGPHQLSGLAEGHAFHLREVTVQGGVLPDAAFRLQRGVRLSGVLRSASGEPVTGTVELRRLDWEGTLLRTVKTDERGHFAFVDLRERSAELVGRVGGRQGRRYVQLPSESADLTVTESPLAQMKVGAASGDEGRVAEARPGPARIVTVVDPEGKPVAGARVSFVERGVDPALALFQGGGADLIGYSDPAGKISVPRDADACLIARAAPFAASALEPCISTEDGDEVTLTLRRPAWIHGGAAVGAGALVAEAPEGFRAATDERGEFRLGPLGPGEHELLVTDAKGEPRSRVKVTVTEGEEVVVRVTDE